jgi:hypothetical protein
MGALFGKTFLLVQVIEEGAYVVLAMGLGSYRCDFGRVI